MAAVDDATADPRPEGEMNQRVVLLPSSEVPLAKGRSRAVVLEIHRQVECLLDRRPQIDLFNQVALRCVELSNVARLGVNQSRCGDGHRIDRPARLHFLEALEELALESVRLGRFSRDISDKIAVRRADSSVKIGAADAEESDESHTRYIQIKHIVILAYTIAQCWVGKREQRPTDTSNLVNITSTVQQGEPVYLIGELPNREEDAEFNPQSYSCLFGFTQEITDLDLVPHNTITVFRDGEPINVETDEDGENTYTDADGNEISSAYVTEGSQDAGQIEIETRTVVPTSAYNIDWLHQRSADYTGDDDQIGYAETIPTEQDPWPHHSQSAPDDGGGIDIRHPVTVWSNEEIN